MQALFAGPYEYPEGAGFPGRCFLQLYGQAGHTVLAVVTALPAAAGPAVTHLTQDLAAHVWVATGRPPTFVWVRHNPAAADQAAGAEEWSWGSFARRAGDRFSDPVWHPLPAAALAAVIHGAQPLPSEWRAFPAPAYSPPTVLALLHRCHALAAKFGTAGYRAAVTPDEQALLDELRCVRDAGAFESEIQTQALRQAAGLRPSDLSMLLGRLHADDIRADPRLAILEAVAALQGTRNNPQTS